jgi:hypothetical protein
LAEIQNQDSAAAASSGKKEGHIMLETTTAADVIADNISDAQVDKFFESGGELETQEAEAQEDTQQEKVVAAKEEATPETQAKEKVVPYGALHEERERRKELAQQNKELQERTSRLETTFQKLMERANQTQEQVPNYDEDPLGALKYENEQIKRQIQYQNQLEQVRQQEQQYSQQEQQFRNAYRQAAGQFSKENTDFIDAYKHLVQSRFDEHLAAGFDETTANRLIEEDEKAIATKAFQDGVNPAERIYKLAQIRGYQKSTPAPQQQTQKNVEKLANLEKGMNASKSLSNVSGKTAKSEITLAQVADMNEDEMTEFLSDKNWKKLMKQG